MKRLVRVDESWIDPDAVEGIFPVKEQGASDVLFRSGEVATVKGTPEEVVLQMQAIAGSVEE